MQNGWSDKGQLQDIICQKENQERIYYILVEQGFIINSGISEFMKNSQEIGFLKYLKQLGVILISGY